MILFHSAVDEAALIWQGLALWGFKPHEIRLSTIPFGAFHGVADFFYTVECPSSAG